jgi:hypothetical protein
MRQEKPEESPMQIKATMTTVVGLIALLSFQLQADCNDELTNLDQRIADTELDVNLRNAVLQFRNQAAAMCDQGNDAAATQMLGIVTMMLPPAQAEIAADKESDIESKSRLTNEFLKGTWCSMTGEERSQLVFAADGTSKACLHDSALGPYGHCFKFKSTTEWLSGYERADSVEQNQIVFSSKRKGQSKLRGDQSIFKRGECKLHGR